MGDTVSMVTVAPYLRMVGLSGLLSFASLSPAALRAQPSDDFQAITGAREDLRTTSVMGSPVDATPVEPSGKTCAAKWRDYQRSTMCYMQFRSRRYVSPQAANQCGAPVKEPQDCPRPSTGQ